jgi:hypothetical protein
MKKLGLVLILIIQNFGLKSQTDTLVTLGGSKVSVIITEITTRDVIYRIPSKPNLPLLHYSRSNLQEIILSDGSSINPKFRNVNPLDKAESEKGKYILYFTPSKIFQNQIGIAYEYIFNDHLVGIRIPFSIAALNPTKIDKEGVLMHESDNKRFFTTGIDLNFYPFRIGKFRYVVGLGLQYAQFSYEKFHYTNNYPIYYPNNSYGYYTKERGNHYSFVVNNGFISKLNKHFVISGSAGFGLQFENVSTNYSNGRGLRLNLSLNIGYMF